MTPWTATAVAIAVAALSWAALSAGGAERWRRRSAGLLQRLEAVRRAPMPASYDARREPRACRNRCSAISAPC